MWAVALAYAAAMIVWAAAGVPHLLKRYFGQRRPADGPEADYDDRPPP